MGKSLVITRFPLATGDLFNGGAQRLSMFMKALGRITSEINVLNFSDHPELAAPDRKALASRLSMQWGAEVQLSLVPVAPRDQTFWSHYGAGILSFHGHPRWETVSRAPQVEAVQKQLRCQPDIVFGHRLWGMCPLLKSGWRHPNTFFDLDDIEHRFHIRSVLAEPVRAGNLLELAQVPAIMFGERRTAALARAVFVCSDGDRRYLRRTGLVRNALVIPNGVETSACAPSFTTDPTLLFLGGYGYKPNVMAAERLVTRIWPHVRRLCPGARLIIAGSKPESLPSYRSRPEGVAFPGFVRDLAALYESARVVCCPVDVAGGTRIKLIEAAAHAKPMVSTRIGAEGLLFLNGTEIVIRDDDLEFAKTCAALLQSDERCRSLGLAAREKVLSLYDAALIEKQISRIFESRAV